MQTKPLYFNDCQQEAMYTAANTTVIVGGRRIGKSHGIIAPSLLRDVQAMPRSAGAIVAATFQQALTRTLPATLTALKEMGYKRDIHYVIGKRPPKHLCFDVPIIEPHNFDHIISWYNGSIQHIISQDVKGSSNSLTLDYIKIDEAKYIDYEQLKDETLPANGGITKYFGACAWHHGLLIVSDMPQSKKGSWFLNYADKQDNELIEAIQALVCEIYHLQQQPDTQDNRRIIAEAKRDLAQFRNIAVYYREWSSIENIQVLGEKYIKQMKRDLPPLIFQTSILCKRLGKLKDGFYPSLDETMHSYTAFNNSYLLNMEYDFEKIGKDSRQDGDTNPDRPICIAFDYNANINWLVAAQQNGLKMNVLKSFYVKYNRKLRELVDDFCNYYHYHRAKEVIYYYDNTALGSNYAVNDDDFASVICEQFVKNGWYVTRKHIGNPLQHREKHIIIDQALKGQRYLLPVFNRDNNEALWLALTHTGIVLNSRGFQKDKTGEKYAESEEDLLEHRTDGTDAFDTLFIGMNLYPQAGSSFILGSAIV